MWVVYSKVYEMRSLWQKTFACDKILTVSMNGSSAYRGWQTLRHSFRSLALTVWEVLKIGRKRVTHSLTDWINDGGVCRTAPATPGLLKIYIKCLLKNVTRDMRQLTPDMWHWTSDTTCVSSRHSQKFELVGLWWKQKLNLPSRVENKLSFS